tara:strand:- start:2590 stop:2898 length:309 start_codon:yes stop_codon:yes gene_type:complete
MGSTMLPPSNQNVPNMMGMNPQMFQHYMQYQQNQRLVDSANQIPQQMRPQQHQQPLPQFQNQQMASMGQQQQPQMNAYLPQQGGNMGLSSLPGAGRHGKPFV